MKLQQNELADEASAWLATDEYRQFLESCRESGDYRPLATIAFVRGAKYGADLVASHFEASYTLSRVRR